jgi:hypothetical protein
MTEEGLAYLLAMILFALSVLLYWLSHYWDIQLSQVLVYAAMAFLLYGFWSYLAPILKRAIDSCIKNVLSFWQEVPYETCRKPPSARAASRARY